MLYLDSSALVKLVLAETETDALRDELARLDVPVVSSQLAIVEVTRAVRRTAPDDAALLNATAALLGEGVGLIPMQRHVLDAAGLLDPVTVRSLDAIHIATATSLQPDLIAFVAYDIRATEAAAAAGLTTAAPGQS